MAPPSLGVRSRRKQAEAKVVQSQELESPDDEPEPSAAEREAVMRRVQRMPNLRLSDVVGQGNHFLSMTVKRKMAMTLLENHCPQPTTCSKLTPNV
ncbi:MAG: hypothetical protein VYA34_02360 [Myxococcota bacterium]|nr:hypothetical protein [Myxococcota bacterium]